MKVKNDEFEIANLRNFFHRERSTVTWRSEEVSFVTNPYGKMEGEAVQALLLSNGD